MISLIVSFLFIVFWFVSLYEYFWFVHLYKWYRSLSSFYGCYQVFLDDSIFLAKTLSISEAVSWITTNGWSNIQVETDS